MEIPFYDLRRAHAPIERELTDAAARVMKSGYFIHGEEVVAFEREFATYCGATHCIGTGNGLDAIQLALRALGIQPDDEVIVPAHTFVATWLAVSQVGATPVPVEPQPDTYNIDPSQIERHITSRTKAILVVHLYGLPVDMTAVLAIAGRYGLPVVEDAAQAHGARVGAQRVGGVSTIAAFSFYPGKNLGALGDGGAVVTNDAALADAVRMLGNYGSKRRYYHDIQGTNSRLDSLQAAFLRAKLPWLDQWNERRQAVAQRYRERLSDLPDVTLPFVPDFASPVWHQFIVRHPRRQALQDALTARGIGSLVHYPVPPHRSGAYQGMVKAALPLTEQLCDTVLSLPIGAYLTDEEVDYVASTICDFARTQ